MRLTAEEHPETIKRYAHVKPARGRTAKSCRARGPGGPERSGGARTCTREAGHRGPHVAHGAFRKIMAVWDAPGTPVPRQDEGRHGGGVDRRRPRRGGSVGRPPRPSMGLFGTLRNRFLRTFGSVEDVAMFVLLLAFVGFAVYWFGLLLG